MFCYRFYIYPILICSQLFSISIIVKRSSNSISYSTNNGLSAGYTQTTTMWNANITKDFFKDKRAQIKIQLYDILGLRITATPHMLG